MEHFSFPLQMANKLKATKVMVRKGVQSSIAQTRKNESVGNAAHWTAVATVRPGSARSAGAAPTAGHLTIIKTNRPIKRSSKWDSYYHRLCKCSSVERVGWPTPLLGES